VFERFADAFYITRVSKKKSWIIGKTLGDKKVNRRRKCSVLNVYDDLLKIQRMI
jgi:hypothetical protein